MDGDDPDWIYDEEEEDETMPPDPVMDEFESWQDALADAYDDTPNHPDGESIMKVERWTPDMPDLVLRESFAEIFE